MLDNVHEVNYSSYDTLRGSIVNKMSGFRQKQQRDAKKKELMEYLELEINAKNTAAVVLTLSNLANHPYLNPNRDKDDPILQKDSKIFINELIKKTLELTVERGLITTGDNEILQECFSKRSDPKKIITTDMASRIQSYKFHKYSLVIAKSAASVAPPLAKPVNPRASASLPLKQPPQLKPRPPTIPRPPEIQPAFLLQSSLTPIPGIVPATNTPGGRCERLLISGSFDPPELIMDSSTSYIVDLNFCRISLANQANLWFAQDPTNQEVLKLHREILKIDLLWYQREAKKMELVLKSIMQKPLDSRDLPNQLELTIQYKKINDMILVCLEVIKDPSSIEKLVMQPEDIFYQNLSTYFERYQLMMGRKRPAPTENSSFEHEPLQKQTHIEAITGSLDAASQRFFQPAAAAAASEPLPIDSLPIPIAESGPDLDLLNILDNILNPPTSEGSNYAL